MNESDVYKKCPVCGYEFEMNYGSFMKPEILKGDKSFIAIKCIGRPFETDKEISDDYRPRKYMEAYMYGCPECGAVHFEEAK